MLKISRIQGTGLDPVEIVFIVGGQGLSQDISTH
jgi:hypothetical protein